MVFGVDVLDVDFWVQVHSTEQPIINFPVILSLRFGLGVGALRFIAHSISRRLTVDLFARSISLCLGVPRRMQYFYDSVELCETAVCFLHIQLMGTNVRLPKIQNTSPEVDSESSRYPAKFASWNKPNRQC